MGGLESFCLVVCEMGSLGYRDKMRTESFLIQEGWCG